MPNALWLGWSLELNWELWLGCLHLERRQWQPMQKVNTVFKKKLRSSTKERGGNNPPTALRSDLNAGRIQRRMHLNATCKCKSSPGVTYLGTGIAFLTQGVKVAVGSNINIYLITGVARKSLDSSDVSTPQVNNRKFNSLAHCYPKSYTPVWFIVGNIKLISGV